MLFADVPVADEGCEHRAYFKHIIHDLWENGYQWCSAQTDETRTHGEHGIRDGSHDSGKPGMGVPEDEWKVDGQGNRRCNRKPAHHFHTGILAPDHHDIEWDEEPGK